MSARLDNPHGFSIPTQSISGELSARPSTKELEGGVAGEPNKRNPQPFVPIDWGTLINRARCWENYSQAEWETIIVCLEHRQNRFLSKKVSARKKSVSQARIEVLRGLRNCFRLSRRNRQLSLSKYHHWSGMLLHLTHKRFQDVAGDRATDKVRKMVLRLADDYGLISRQQVEIIKDGEIIGSELFILWNDERWDQLVEEAQKLSKNITLMARKYSAKMTREGGSAIAQIDTSLRVANFYLGSTSVSPSLSTGLSSGPEGPGTYSYTGSGLWVLGNDSGSGFATSASGGEKGKSDTNPRKAGDVVKNSPFIPPEEKATILKISSINPEVQPINPEADSTNGGGSSRFPLHPKKPGPPPISPAGPPSHKSRQTAGNSPTTRSKMAAGTKTPQELPNGCRSQLEADLEAEAAAAEKALQTVSSSAAATIPQDMWRKENSGVLPGKKVKISTGNRNYDISANIWVRPDDDPYELFKFKACRETVEILALLQANDEKYKTQEDVPTFYPEAYLFANVRALDCKIKYHRGGPSLPAVKDWLDARNGFKQGLEDPTWDFKITEFSALIKYWDQINIITQKSISHWKYYREDNDFFLPQICIDDDKRDFLAAYPTWSPEKQARNVDKYQEFKNYFAANAAAHEIENEIYHESNCSRLNFYDELEEYVKQGGRVY